MSFCVELYISGFWVVLSEAQACSGDIAPEMEVFVVTVPQRVLYNQSLGIFAGPL
jgi:hypothetical protein